MWGRWVSFIASTERGTTLALFRMGVGAALLLTVGWVVFGGVTDAVWMDRSHGGIHRLRGSPLVQLLGGANPGVIYGLVAANLMAGVLLILGVGGRVTAFVALQVALGLLRNNPYADAAYDTLLTNGLWLLVLGSSTQTLSVDAKLRTGSWIDPTPIGRWARYLVVFQLAVMYCATGLQKLSVHWVPWGDLHALWYVLQMANFHYQDHSWLAGFAPLLQLSTLITWVWEILGGVFLLAALGSDRGAPGWRRVRRGMVGIGLVMHVVLFFTMELGPFGFTTLIFYLALYSPAEVEAAGARWLPQSVRR